MFRLTQKVNYVWRVLGTGLGFASFGLGGVLIALLVSPTVKLLRKEPEQRAILTQKVIKYGFRSFIEGLRLWGVMTYEVKGLEKLEKSYGELVVANHPTLLDVVMLIAFMPRANCVVKQALWENPFTHAPVKSAGYILNQGSQAFIDACIDKLEQPQAGSLVIFPEGTRTEKQQILNDFQRGAANIAVRANVPIRPVVIRCTPSTLTKNEKWYHIPSKAFHLELEVLDAIDLVEILHEPEVSPKTVRQFNTWLYDFFYGKLAHEQFSK